MSMIATQHKYSVFTHLRTHHSLSSEWINTAVYYRNNGISIV